MFRRALSIAFRATALAVLAILILPHITNAQAIPPEYTLPAPIEDLLSWVYGSAFSIQLLNNVAARIDIRYGTGSGAAWISLGVNALAVGWGALNESFGGPPEGIEGYLGRLALLLLSTYVAYKTNVGKLLPSPSAPPEPVPVLAVPSQATAPTSADRTSQLR